MHHSHARSGAVSTSTVAGSVSWHVVYRRSEPRSGSIGQSGPVNYNRPGRQCSVMSLSLEHNCPECGKTREFYRTASTEMHLGTKEKWRCPECEYGFVTVGGIDSSVATA